MELELVLVARFASHLESDSPRRAIECARTAGQAVRSIGLEIRAGLHTGEIEVTAGRTW